MHFFFHLYCRQTMFNTQSDVCSNSFNTLTCTIASLLPSPRLLSVPNFSKPTSTWTASGVGCLRKMSRRMLRSSWTCRVVECGKIGCAKQKKNIGAQVSHAVIVRQQYTQRGATQGVAHLKSNLSLNQGIQSNCVINTRRPCHHKPTRRHQCTSIGHCSGSSTVDTDLEPVDSDLPNRPPC